MAYVVDRGHVQYAGRLALAEQAHYVRQGHGRSGNNRDYVLSTVKSIEAQGFRDPKLHQLAGLLRDDAPVRGLDLGRRTLHAPEQLRLLQPPGLNQAIGRLLDRCLHAREEFVAPQSRRQRIEELDHHGPG